MNSGMCLYFLLCGLYSYLLVIDQPDGMMMPQLTDRYL